MTTANVAAYHAYVDAFNRRDFDAVRAAMHPDIVDHHLPAEVPQGVDGVVGWLELLAATLTMHLEVELAVDAGDRVAASGRISGHHVGEFPGLPPTNRRFEVAITTVERFRDGRIAERWEEFDLKGLMAQLDGGASPD